MPKIDEHQTPCRILCVGIDARGMRGISELQGQVQSYGNTSLNFPQPSARFSAPAAPTAAPWPMVSVPDAEEALRCIQSAIAQGTSIPLVLLGTRSTAIPDGLHWIRKMWRCQPDLQVVICCEDSTTVREHVVRGLEAAGNYVMVRTPIDPFEVQPLLQAMLRKADLTGQLQRHQTEMDETVAQQTEKLTVANRQLEAEIRRRERTELELRGSEHRFEMAFKSAAVPMAILHTPTLSFLEVNDSFTKLVALPRISILGNSAADLGLLVRPQEYQMALDLAKRAGRARDLSCRIQPSTGEARDTVISLEPVVLGEEPCLLMAMLDVTEQRKLELELRQSQKMDAIGQLAAGVAHDFNNLLTVIHGHASLQIARTDLDDTIIHSLTQVKLAADRAATLTRQLLAFSRKQVMQRRSISLNNSIERLQSMLKRLLGETIQLECDCDSGLPCIFADENSMDQIIMNLAVNARDAMPSGGKVTISTREIEIRPGDPGHGSDARPGRFVRLSVVDNGTGMDSTVLGRIFEPFFTTKAQGKGTGLGLSTVYGIVKQHDGWIEVESAPALGSKFHVFLAVTDRQLEKTSDTTFFPLKAPQQGQKERVLVVEDEPELREFITMVLQNQGYGILSAGDGLEALQVWQKEPEPIDLLLTDIIMPNGLSGTRLAGQMLARRPDLRVLYISGYSQELMDGATRLPAGVNFLPKPFDVSKLLTAVRRCLDEKS
jgi:signal transduction histidine kinase/ActR/RegA family two-component response regulator